MVRYLKIQYGIIILTVCLSSHVFTEQSLPEKPKGLLGTVERQELQINDLINVFQKYATTELGKSGITQLFSSDICRSSIENNQIVIKKLVTDEDLFNTLQKSLLEVEKGAKALQAGSDFLLSDRMVYYSFPYEERLKRIIPVSQLLNNSACALELSVWQAMCLSVSAIIMPFYDKIKSGGKDYNIRRNKTIFATYPLEQQQYVREFLHKRGFKNLNDENCMKYWLTDEEFKERVWALGSAGDRYHIVKCELGDACMDKIMAGSIVLVSTLYNDLARFGMSALSISLPITIWYELKELQEKMVAIAFITRSLDSVIESINRINKETAYTLSDRACYLINKKEWSNKLQSLVDLLQTSTFDSVSSWFYSRGKILRAYKLLQEVQEEISTITYALAEFDAYHALAKFYRQQQDKNVQFSFVQFIESNKPQILIKDVWTPLVDPEKAVINDVQLGVHNQPIRAIITGPNGCGKSTYLKAIGHAIFLAHVCGIAPASSAQMTMFDSIHTSLHPQEDLLKGISAFMAQKMRIDEVLKSIEQSSTHKKMLAIFDEPFNGTTEAQIAQRVHQLGLDASQLPYSCVCVATHVEKPTLLARNGSFANYQVEINEPAFGEFVRTFKILPGPAQWWFTDHARVTRYVDWIGNYTSIKANSEKDLE
jgi:hypothetical protein